MPISWRRMLAAGAAVAVAGGLLVQTTTGSAAESTAAICDLFCDGRDAGLATSERRPVTATLFGRTFTAHVSDKDTMMWGSVGNGLAGDEVWLDRSFDGGRTFASGSRLGVTTTPAGAGGTRTAMFNVDNWATRAVGVLRACGKAAGRGEVVCTPWARSTWNAGDRRTAAATALMMRYDQGTGLFDGNGWWTAPTR